MTRGDRPAYALSRVKAVFADPGRLNRTMSAALGAEDCGLDAQALVDLIAGLTRRDFDKSMASEVDASVRQDVYKPVIGGREIYVKFTLDARGALLLISCKENMP